MGYRTVCLIDNCLHALYCKHVLQWHEFERERFNKNTVKTTKKVSWVINWVLQYRPLSAAPASAWAKKGQNTGPATLVKMLNRAVPVQKNTIFYLFCLCQVSSRLWRGWRGSRTRPPARRRTGQRSPSSSDSRPHSMRWRRLLLYFFLISLRGLYFTSKILSPLPSILKSYFPPLLDQIWGVLFFISPSTSPNYGWYRYFSLLDLMGIKDDDMHTVLYDFPILIYI